jgi:hypothetical protein
MKKQGGFMKRDRQSLAHDTQEEMSFFAVQRMKKGESPRPGQRQSISAASVLGAKSVSWSATFAGALDDLMLRRKKAPHLVVDRLSTYRKALVGD